jgi:predicted transposase/invertase (TIGR01784 family)
LSIAVPNRCDSLTPKENEFMKTMEEIDLWYEDQINKAQLEGEHHQKQKIAHKLLQENFPLTMIAEVTGLTIDQLQQLQSASNNG